MVLKPRCTPHLPHSCLVVLAVRIRNRHTPMPLITIPFASRLLRSLSCAQQHASAASHVAASQVAQTVDDITRSATHRSASTSACTSACTSALTRSPGPSSTRKTAWQHWSCHPQHQHRLMHGVAAALPAGVNTALKGGLLATLRSLHSSAHPAHAAAAAAAAADGASPSSASRTGTAQPLSPSETSAPLEVHSPLQDLYTAASESPLQQLGGDMGAAGQGGELGRRRREPGDVEYRPRSWVWYDEADERKEQRKERSGLAVRYADAGFARQINAPQSIKKMNRILAMVRGLTYKEALYQCRLRPQKAARIVIECLEKAREDAVSKGLDESKLVVGTLFATKGQYEKGITIMGKGKAGRRFTRKSHITVALREAREPRDGDTAMQAQLLGPIGSGRRAPRGLAFGARVVPAAMVALSAARRGGVQRRRFDYRNEV